MPAEMVIWMFSWHRESEVTREQLSDWKFSVIFIVSLVRQRAQIPLVGHWRAGKWGHRDFQWFGFQYHVFEMLRTNYSIEFMCPGGWHPSLSGGGHCVPHLNSYFEAINPTIIGCESI